MEKIVIGRPGGRKAGKPVRRKSGWERAYFALGLLLVGGMLFGSLAESGGEARKFTSREAVAVMSTAARDPGTEAGSGEREMLRQPERYAVKTEDWSVFDAVGMFFAELIRGW